MNNYTKYIIVFMAFISSTSINAQFGDQQIITTEVNGVRNVIPSDINGDGLVDILYSSRFDGNVGWIQNIDGTGVFSNLNIIGDVEFAGFLNAADLDGDGDQDVLAVSGSQNLVVWFENLDGLGNFSTVKIVSSNTIGAFAVAGADVNGDGFMDIVASAGSESAIYWYENNNNDGTFSVKQLIAFQANNGRHFNLVDIDDDNDLDVVASSSGSEVLTWYENLDGLGNFGAPNIIAPAAQAVSSLYSADFDGDEDLDVVTVSIGDNEVAWYENLDGLGAFSTKKSISTNDIEVVSAFVADLDNDGDNDILTASANFQTRIHWYENLDGLGMFSDKQEIFNLENGSVATASAADLDNDGDMDPISSTFIDDKIAWYENFTILNIENQALATLKIYPNPTDGFLNINAKDTVIEKITIFNIQGKVVLRQEKDLTTIPVHNLKSGVYFLKAETAKGELVEQFVKE
ncbi:T9SS type A sorting domain-containing protein [Patiriisocius marinus]|uniref:T9SS type A sorting domain-containing protein n=1 Tax=Patiriisocius marinus TaxID=1397112 RepID=UPI00232E2AB2|nr:T9SS type A sorting domain-containing protein [Patiriisocius marinus]